MRDYMDRQVTPLKRVTSPTWGPPPPCKQAFTQVRHDESRVSHLQCGRENLEHLKYLRNVYCFRTNHTKDQDTRTSHKTIK